MIRRAAVLVLLAGAGACVEQSTAPGVCPDFCPSGAIDVKDTVLDIVGRDSAYRGYRQSYQAELMSVADSPGVIDSRAIFRMNTVATDSIVGSDTLPVIADSARLLMVLARRDTNATNLYVKLYHLPITIDTTTTFSDLVPQFSGKATDSVNINDLLTRPALLDSTTKTQFGQDSVRTDSAGHWLQIIRTATDTMLKVFFDLDTTQVPFVAADSGKTAWGVRAHGDSLASVAIGSNTLTGSDPQIKWFYHFTIHDTTGVKPDTVVARTVQKATTFHNFVFDPPNPALDDNLTVGGVPSARSVVRIAFPPSLRDSADIVRATLILVPVAPVAAYARDSFSVIAQPVVTDLGAKSPLTTNTTLYGITTVHTNSPDTVRIELSDVLRRWAADTTAATTLMLIHSNEASSYTEIRFFSTRGAFRPSLQITYVKRFEFGGSP